MKITEIWHTKKKPTISFELFPARNEKATANLEKVIDKLACLQPDFISVTFGAGGTTREGSYKLLVKLKVEKGLEILPYFTCFGLGPHEITSILNSYSELGVESLLAVRGDPPRKAENYRPHPESLSHASDLLAFIQPRYNFCLGAAGYPEGHIEATSMEKDLDFLKLKVNHGAEFIIANYFYDNTCFFDFVDRCRKIDIQVPILPGVMPIFSIKMMENLASLCGATITDEIRAGLTALPEGDKKALLNFGIDFATRQCRELLENGAVGLHIYTMDRSRSAVEITERLRADGYL